MTKKDYVLIAEAIKAGNSYKYDSAIQTAVSTRIAERLADSLASDNPRFDRARFLAACGV